MLTEIIRAKLINTRRTIGAEIHQDSTTYKDPPVKRVPIRDIRTSWEGGAHFVKGHPDYAEPAARDHIENIKHAMRHGEKVPPVTVRRNPTGLGYEVIDGNHRYQAHKEVNHKEVDVQEVPPFLAQGKRRKRITGKRKKMYESSCPIVSTIRKVVSKARKDK